MTLDEAIKALEAAREVSGGDAWLAASILGKEGWTSRLVALAGPCRFKADVEHRHAYVLAVRREEEAELDGGAGVRSFSQITDLHKLLASAHDTFNAVKFEEGEAWNGELRERVRVVQRRIRVTLGLETADDARQEPHGGLRSLVLSLDAHEAAEKADVQRFDRASYIAGYQDAIVDVDEVLRE